MTHTQTKLIGLMTVFGIISISIFAWIGGGADLFKVFLKDSESAYSSENIERVSNEGMGKFSQKFTVSEGTNGGWKMSYPGSWAGLYPNPWNPSGQYYLEFSSSEVDSLLSGEKITRTIGKKTGKYTFWTDSYLSNETGNEKVLYMEETIKNLYVVSSKSTTGGVGNIINKSSNSSLSSSSDISSSSEDSFLSSGSSAECGIVETCLVGDFVDIEDGSMTIQWSCIHEESTRYCAVPMVGHKNGDQCLDQKNNVVNFRNCETINPFVPDPTSYASREADIVNKFKTAYGPYSSKEDLSPQKLANGKDLYIVNSGYMATSLPSCVNGKVTQDGCLPTGWTMGIKKNEVYAVRYRTRKLSEGNGYSPYNAASLAMTRNQKSGGRVNQSDNVYNISDRPGDMTGSPFEGKCSTSSINSTGGLYFTYPGSDLLSKGFYCAVPEDTVFYVNVELNPRDYDQCEAYSDHWNRESVCSGYMYQNGLISAESDQILKGAVFGAPRGCGLSESSDNGNPLSIPDDSTASLYQLNDKTCTLYDDVYCKNENLSSLSAENQGGWYKNLSACQNYLDYMETDEYKAVMDTYNSH